MANWFLKMGYMPNWLNCNLSDYKESERKTIIHFEPLYGKTYNGFGLKLKITSRWTMIGGFCVY